MWPWIYGLKSLLKLLFSGLNVFYELFKTLPKIPGKLPKYITSSILWIIIAIEPLEYVCNCEGAIYRLLTYVHDCLNLLYSSFDLQCPNLCKFCEISCGLMNL